MRHTASRAFQISDHGKSSHRSVHICPAILPRTRRTSFFEKPFRFLSRQSLLESMEIRKGGTKPLFVWCVLFCLTWPVLPYVHVLIGIPDTSGSQDGCCLPEPLLIFPSFLTSSLLIQFFFAVENTLTAFGPVPAFPTDLLMVNCHAHMVKDPFNCFCHWHIQSPSDTP